MDGTNFRATMRYFQILAKKKWGNSKSGSTYEFMKILAGHNAELSYFVHRIGCLTTHYTASSETISTNETPAI